MGDNLGEEWNFTQEKNLRKNFLLKSETKEGSMYIIRICGKLFEDVLKSTILNAKLIYICKHRADLIRGMTIVV